MSTQYEMKYLCLNCNRRRHTITNHRLTDFVHRKCRKCKAYKEKVIYLRKIPK